MRRNRIVLGLAVLLIGVTLVSGCRPAKAGARCKGTELGRDGSHVLTCTKGRWTRAISFYDLSQLLARPKATRTLTDVVEVTTGQRVTCAVVRDGGVKCWGGNDDGELGTGSTDYWRMNPEYVPGISGATAVSSTRYHVCALATGGTAKCWGNGTLGQLGNGGFDDSRTPVDVFGLSGATAISAGLDSTCVIVSRGEVQCWGYGPYGGLGNWSSESSAVPVQVRDISGATAIGVGADFACALLADRTVQCWGRNDEGQLGDGTKQGRAYAAPVVDLPGPVTAITVGGNSACAVLESGRIRCWGHNSAGQLGFETPDYTPRPIEVPSVSDAVQVSMGTGSHPCALTAGGAVTCWGYNGNGALGDGTTVSRSDPGGIVAVTGATQVSAGGGHVCARSVDATLRCWGGNVGGRVQADSPWGSAWPTQIVEGI